MSISVAFSDAGPGLLAKAKQAFGAAGLGSGLGAGLALAVLAMTDWFWPAAVQPEPVLTVGQGVLTWLFVVIVATALGAFAMFFPAIICWELSQRMPFKEASFILLLIVVSVIVATVMNRTGQLPAFDPIYLVVMGFIGLCIALVRLRLANDA